MPNIIQYENVVFTVGGQNPQTRTIQVPFSIDPVTGIGTASASFTYTGTNSGVDTVTAALPSFSFTSNAATVAWQSCPSLISAGNVISVGVFHNGQSLGFNVSAPVPFDYTLTVQSLYFNTSKFFNIPGFGQDLGHQQPGLFQNITPQGTYAGPPETVLQNANGSIKDGGNTVFKMVWQGSFVVQQPGNYNIQMSVDDSCIICIGNGATLVSGNIYNPYGQTTGPFTGYPVLMAANSSKANNAAQSPNPESSIINFPTAGIYPFEIDYNNFEGPGAELDISFNGQTIIIPVALLAVPAQPDPGNGNLLLTPTGGAGNLLIQGQQVTLSLALQNVQFQTQSLIPILEGNVGQIYIYNNPLSPVFSFLSYYGATPDGPSAAVADFVLVGDNIAWQGQMSLRWDSTVNKFKLSYNGSQSLADNQLFAPNVQFTTLTVTQDDIAWFNGSSASYDTFQATSAGGGKLANIPLYYLLNPNYPASSAVQVSPATVIADGTPKTFTVSLARPLPPLQNNTAMNVAFGGAQTRARFRFRDTEPCHYFRCAELVGELYSHGDMGGRRRGDDLDNAIFIHRPIHHLFGRQLHPDRRCDRRWRKHSVCGGIFSYSPDWKLSCRFGIPHRRKQRPLRCPSGEHWDIAHPEQCCWRFGITRRLGNRAGRIHYTSELHLPVQCAAQRNHHAASGQCDQSGECQPDGTEWGNSRGHSGNRRDYGFNGHMDFRKQQFFEHDILYYPAGRCAPITWCCTVFVRGYYKHRRRQISGGVHAFCKHIGIL